jgi:membrane protein DedA with SNARE-associated domain
VMAYCGYLAWQGRLDWAASIVIAGTGAALGITIAYWVGNILGSPFFNKYGHRFHMGPDRMAQTEKWFEKYGDVTIVFAYYIIGVRHVTGYLSGIIKKPFHRFAVYAYIGAFLWAVVFVSIGKLFGQEWKHFYGLVDRYLFVGSFVLVVSIVIVYLVRKYRSD